MRVNHFNDHRSACAQLIVRIFRYSKWFTLAATLSFLLFQFPAFAGLDDKLPPAAPNANMAVAQPPGGDIEVRAANGTGEKLVTGTIRREFEFGTLRVTLEDKLAEYNSLEQRNGEQHPTVVQLLTEIITELRTTLAGDIVHAKKDLDIDRTTRGETKKLDEKYALLQTAMHNLRNGASKAATLRSVADVEVFFKKVVAASAAGPRRVQFVAPANFLGGHFVAGDLYIDQHRKLASLVTWDSISDTPLSLPGLLDQVLPNDFTRVSHEILTDIQRIPTGCRQCSLQFTEQMAKIDLHSEQISRLVSDQGSEFENMVLSESKKILSVSRVKGNDENVSIETLRLTNSTGILDKALRVRFDRDTEDFRQGRISADELSDRIKQRAAVAADVNTRRKTRTISTNDNKRVEIKTNLLIDEMRSADLEEVLRILNSDGATDLINESRQLFERVADRAGEAGEAQSELIAPLDDALEETTKTWRSSLKRRVPLTSQSAFTSDSNPKSEITPIDQLSSRDSVSGPVAWHPPTSPGGRAERVDRTNIGNDEEVRAPYTDFLRAPPGQPEAELFADDNRPFAEILEEGRQLNRRDF